jgi:hypothetical protein
VDSKDQVRNHLEDLPVALFKYLPPARLISVLRDLEIRFTQASSLNDTLELKPPIKGVAEPEKLEGIFRGELTSSLWSQTSPAAKNELERRFPGMSDSLGEAFLQIYTRKGCEAVEQRHERNPTAVFEVMDHNFGILCLAESAADLKIWSHYADGGRGFLMEFDPTHSWFHGKREARDSFRHLRQVKYVFERPKAHLLDTTELEFLYTKWAMWQDEREWRIIRNFNEHSRRLDHRDPYGNEILLFSVPPESIKSAVLGYSAKPELEAEIRAILTANEALAHVGLRRATLSNETGQIAITLQGGVSHSKVR